MRVLMALFALFAVPVAAQDIVTPEIGYFEAGIVCEGEVVGATLAPGTEAGEVMLLDDTPPFVSHSRRVPAVPGVGFGVLVAVAGEADPRTVLMRVSHPPFTGSGTEVETFVSALGSPGDPSIHLFRFDRDYEMVPGPWVMEALRDGELLYRAEFTVLPPAQVPELAGICDYESLLSGLPGGGVG